MRNLEELFEEKNQIAEKQLDLIADRIKELEFEQFKANPELMDKPQCRPAGTSTRRSKSYGSLHDAIESDVMERNYSIFQ